MSSLTSFPAPFRAVVVGASGGIGRALVEALVESEAVANVVALARRDAGLHHPKVTAGRIDIEEERSIEAAADRCREAAPRLVIVASGLLHDGDALKPEKSLRDLDAGRLARSFAVNTIGPALVIKHFAAVLPPKGKSVIAALSARVGSISDNRLGGWYGYRASKAALNQVLRTASIELARGRRDAAVVGLHPGTVATPLSAPFRGNVAPGKLFTPAHSAARLLEVIDGVTPTGSGRLFAWDGTSIDP